MKRGMLRLAGVGRLAGVAGLAGLSVMGAGPAGPAAGAISQTAQATGTQPNGGQGPGTGARGTRSGGGGTSSTQVSLVQQTAWVEPGQGFDLTLAISSSQPRSDLYLVVNVFAKLSSRSAFDQTLDDQDGSSLLRSFDPVPLTELPTTSNGQLAVHIPVVASAVPGAPANPANTSSTSSGPFSSLDLGSCPSGCGVFPVRVELADSRGISLAQFTTHLVRTDPPAGTIKLGVSYIVPVHAPLSLSNAGATQVPTSWSNGLSTLASSLADCPAVPITLAPTPQTLEALSISHRSVDQATVHTLATVTGGGTTPPAPPSTPPAARGCPAAGSAGGTDGVSLTSGPPTGAGTTPPATSPTPSAPTPPQGLPPGNGLSTKDQVATLPFVPVDLASLSAAHLTSDLQAQMTRSTEVLRADLGARPEPSTWVSTSPLDQTGLQLLHAQSVRQLVVPEPNVAASVKQAITPTSPFRLTSDNTYQPLTLAADPGLASHFTNGPDPVLAAHQLLADLAEIYFDRPADVQARGVVVQAPLNWLPNQVFLQALLGGLAASPIVAPVTLDDLFRIAPATGPSGAPIQRQLAAPGPSPTGLPTAAIVSTRQRLSSFLSVMTAETPTYLRLADLLLSSEAANLSSSDRRRYLDGVRSGISAQLAKIALPQGQSITLTAQAGRIPITIVSSTTYPVHAVLRVSSDDLSFPQGTSQAVVLDTRDTSTYFEVRARTSGAFPLRVSLTSPDGRLSMLTSRFTIRSTAASGVAIALSVGAAAFLLGWWGRSALQGRRDRNRRLVPGQGRAAPAVAIREAGRPAGPAGTT